MGIQNDTINALNLQIQQLKEQLKVKDRLVTKILEPGEDYNEAKLNGLKELNGRHSFRSLDSNKSSKIFLKLKAELDLAYKILSSRDAEISSMKKQTKQ